MEPEEATAGIDPEQEDRIVNRTVEAVKEELRGLVAEVVGGVGKKPPVEEEEGPAEKATVEPSTSQREIEILSEEQVRAAVERITADKEHAEHHAHLKEAERPPQQFSRITKAIWGGP